MEERLFFFFATKPALSFPRLPLTDPFLHSHTIGQALWGEMGRGTTQDSPPLLIPIPSFQPRLFTAFVLSFNPEANLGGCAGFL